MFVARLARKWRSPIYAFYSTRPFIGYADGRRFHSFVCQANSCKHIVRRYLDKNDTGSTGNLRRHAKACWGDDTVRSIESAVSADDALTLLKRDVRLHDGDLGMFFKTKVRGTVSYSHRQHTTAETRYVPSHLHHTPLAHTHA